MVNTGGPSYGCQNCKEARQKCDQGSPACARCTRRKRQCEYPDFLNITFRDETKAIQTKSDRRRRQARELTPQETLVSPLNPESTLTSILSPFTYVGTTQEQFALNVLFSRRAGLKHDKENPHGFIEFLPQLVAVAKPNSPLERATCALALFASQNILDYKETTQSYFQLGRKVLGEALRMTNHAIQDPVACRSDDTLMAVMVINIIDNILCMVDQRAPSEAHLLGASQLIRLRGKKNFENVASRRILAGVHSETVGKALNQCVAVKELPGGFCSDEWFDNLSQYPNFAAGLLNYLAESVASVQAFVRPFLDCPSLFHDTQASALVAAVLNIDQKLIDWESAIPDIWRPRQAGDLSTANLATFQAYGTTMDIYESVWIANTYNSFRTLRILLQVLAHEIMCSFSRVRITVFPFGPLAYSCTAQRLIDEVCASVPFFMGNRAPGTDPAAIRFPAAEGSVPSLADRKVALRVGAWFLCAPLNMCAQYNLIEMRQKIWIESQIERINSFRSLQGSYQGLFPNWQINITSKSISRVAAKAAGTVLFEAMGGV